MLALEWSALARDDLLSIIDYISDVNLAATITLKTEIETRVSAPAMRPKLRRPGRVAGYAKWSFAPITLSSIQKTSERSKFFGFSTPPNRGQQARARDRPPAI